MPLPIVHPKKYRFGREFKRKDTSEYIKLLKYRFNKINDFDEYFLEDWGEKLAEIIDELSTMANDKLRDLIEERAYVENMSEIYYKRTDQFPDAFEVDVYIDEKFGHLHADIIFYYDYLDTREYGYTQGRLGEESAHLIERKTRGLPSYKSVVDGRDMRRKMPDILNTPIKYTWVKPLSYKDKKNGSKRTRHKAVRKGRWYQEFDKWFRGEGEAQFLKMCRERGIIE